MGFDNIWEAGGIGLAVTGLSIVFVALVLVSLFIAGLPRVLPLLNAILPVVEGRHHMLRASSATAEPASVDDEIIAAIGVALHARRSA